MPSAPDFDVMVFDTYTPRPDAQARNYDQWLVDVDCPLFNSLDMIAAYTCWKVLKAKGNRANSARGSNDPYSYFSFFGLSDASGFEAMMADPKAEAHVPLWVSNWSRNPESADMAENFFFSFARLSHFKPGKMAECVVLVPYQCKAAIDGPGYEHWSSNSEAVSAFAETVRYESWVVEKQLQGDYAPNGVDLFFVESFDHANTVWDTAPTAVLGTLVAGPTC